MNCFGSLPSDEDLSAKDLSHKIATLLPLVATSRYSDACSLNTKYNVKIDQTYMNIQIFQKNPNLCVINGTRHSRMDQVKFVGDSLYKI